MFAINMLWHGFKIYVALAGNVLDAIVLCIRLKDEQPAAEFTFEEVQ
jgi:hypothetical protein